MTPSYALDPPSTYAEELNLDRSPLALSSSSSGRTFFSSDQDLCRHPHRDLQSPHQLGHENKEEIRSEDQEDDDDYHSSQKWLPSKLRIIRKMMGSNKLNGNRATTNSHQNFEDPKQFSSPSFDSGATSKGSSGKNTDNAIRVCSDCNTTKTPLWRSGPRGPKSLCNACGIRQRKARRALAAAANGTILPPATKSSIKIKLKRKNKKSKNGEDKLQRPNSSSTNKKNNIWYEDFTSRILSKHYSAYQRVFPQDEREAAILLMALSYGLVHG